jgi:hypothetical protein
MIERRQQEERKEKKIREYEGQKGLVEAQWS